MKVETYKDLLTWTGEFHKNLSSCLQHCASKNENERSRMLLEYLAGHEQELANTVSGFVDTTDTGALKTWCYDYAQNHPLLHSQECKEPFQDMEPDNILAKVIERHEQVIDLYRSLQATADVGAARELMEELESLEAQEARQMTQGANRMQEM